jgi:hypothetical protein
MTAFIYKFTVRRGKWICIVRTWQNIQIIKKEDTGGKSLWRKYKKVQVTELTATMLRKRRISLLFIRKISIFGTVFEMHLNVKHPDFGNFKM